MNYEVEDKIFVNETGNQVKYKRLVVTGYLNGTLEKIELPISREQAIIYNAMKDGNRPEITTKNGGVVKVEKSGSWLD